MSCFIICRQIRISIRIWFALTERLYIVIKHQRIWFFAFNRGSPKKICLNSKYSNFAIQFKKICSYLVLLSSRPYLAIWLSGLVLVLLLLPTLLLTASTVVFLPLGRYGSLRLAFVWVIWFSKFAPSLELIVPWSYSILIVASRSLNRF